MGMDVFGKNATSKKGEYFRNNVWWWHPLWDYCLELHGDICAKVSSGHYNDGDGLGAYEASLLSDRLFADIATGVTANYEATYRKEIADLPRNDCEYCDSTGIRTDQVGIANGMPERELAPEVAIVVGRTHGYCNSCNGEGKVLPWEANYPFSVENVRQFAEFLADCGGFEIC